jgi:hypothetical protein
VGTLNETVEVAIITGALAFTGVLVTVLGSLIAGKRDAANKKLELMFTINGQLVDDLREERAELRARVDALEDARKVQDTEMGSMREAMAHLRTRDAELRTWADQIMSWAAMAVSIIRGMAGSIEDPPAPPRDTDRAN